MLRDDGGGSYRRIHFAGRDMRWNTVDRRTREAGRAFGCNLDDLMSTEYLRYRVGHVARRRLLDGGLQGASLGGLIGPASGPKWLGLVGLDRALLASGILEPVAGRAPLQLLGASAGAWRMLAYASADPVAALGRLQDGYIGQIFSRRDTAAEISACYRRLMGQVVGDSAGSVLGESPFDLAILTCRVRGVRSRPAMAVSLLTAAALHTVTSRGTDWLFERVLFHSRPQRLGPPHRGRLATLTEDNLLNAVLASGTVPFYLESVADLAGAPAGAYIDGGLTDYHPAPMATEGIDEEVWLLPHYRRRVVPRWMDKRRPSRDLRGKAAAQVLQIYPNDAFIASLPGGCLPDREDFKTFVDAPEERISRWQEVARRSDQLGEELLRDMESGRWADKLEAWDGGGANAAA